MIKEFTPHEQALELKELGFNEPCFGYYIETGEWIPASYSREGTVYPSNSDLLPEWVASPTMSQAFRWFREKHGLFATIDGLEERLYYKITQTNEYSKEYNTYEEAELECLKKLIEIIKK